MAKDNKMVSVGIVVLLIVVLGGLAYAFDSSDAIATGPSVDETCLSCHGGIEDYAVDGAFHSANFTGDCLSCHDAEEHGENPTGAFPSLIEGDVDSLCWSCHSGAQDSHPPVDKGSCFECHSNTHAPGF